MREALLKINGLAVLIWVYHNAVSLQAIHPYCEAALWSMHNFF